MLIRSILTIAVLGSLVFGAAANAGGQPGPDSHRGGNSLTAQIDGITSTGAPGTFQGR